MVFLLFCHGRAWALNQINNGTFLSDWSGWTIDNQVRRGFPLEAFSWVATEGAPVGSIFGGMTTNNRQGDGLVEQKFTTPAGFVRASAYLQHKASTNKKSGKNNRTTVTLRLDGSAAYPNETIITTFLSLIQDPTAAFQTMNWTTPVTLRPGTSYLFRLYWDIKTNGALGFYFDNVKLNISPSGLRTDDNGTDVFLSWNPSVGAVALKEYRVFRATTSGGPYTQIATTTATTYTDAAWSRTIFITMLSRMSSWSVVMYPPTASRPCFSRSRCGTVPRRTSRIPG